MYKLFIFLLLASCGMFVKPKKKPPAAPTMEQLEAKQSIYTALVSPHQDAHGFIMTEECDSLLFSGLLSAARPDLHIDIKAARDADGVWHRRPGHDCGPSFNNSRSTISRDMIIGLMWHMWRNKDVESATTLMRDLKARTYWLRGEGTAGELLMTPALVNTLAEMIFRMGGPSFDGERALPAILDDSGDGFIAHLTVLHLLLRGEILGGLFESDIKTLKSYMEKSPQNPLFVGAYHKYSDGDQSAMLAMLMDNEEWPDRSLPTTSNHCDAWPIQRVFDEKNWGACSPEREHTGAELIVVYSLITK